VRHTHSEQTGGYCVIRRLLFGIFTAAATISFLLCLLQLLMLYDTLRDERDFSLTHPGAHLSTFGLPSNGETARAIVITLLLPASWVCWLGLQRRAIRRRQRGRCNTCGYNLTGNTSGACPECGTPVSKISEAIA
jgi:hypothetical protein